MKNGIYQNKGEKNNLFLVKRPFRPFFLLFCQKILLQIKYLFMNIEEKKFLNALNIAFFSNTNAVLKMVNFFGSPEKAFNATKKDLKRMGFKIETISNFFKKRQEINIEKEWQKLKRENIKTITKEEKEYHTLLK